MNKKKLFIVLIIITLILISTFAIFNNKNNTVIKYATLKSSDEKFSIDIPSNIKLKTNSKENNDFTIDLYSVEDEMYMYATNINKTREIDLLDIVNDDFSLYLSDKENIRDNSSVVKSVIRDYKAYEYSLTYFDKEYGKDFYSNIVWIETSNNIYILNFEVVAKNTDTINKFKDIFLNMKNSFIEL